MRRLMEELNYLCKCGHKKRLHEGDYYSLYCNGANFECKCEGYIIDNLSYLEMEVLKREELKCLTQQQES